MSFRLIPPTLVALLTAVPAAAATMEDRQLWVNLTLMGSLSRGIVYFVEAQPRIGKQVSHLDQLLLRPAIGVKLSPKVTLYQGYAHVLLPIADARDRNEERSFQQLNWSIDPRLSSRTRFEQRWLSNGRDTGFRLREMIRYASPLRATPRGIALLGYGELFVALNRTDWGARPGFDQIRGFIGLELPLPGRSTIEAGYMNQTVNAVGSVVRVNHIASLSLFVRR